MSRFRSAHRTIITEIKTFVVDTMSRTGAFRQSVSAKVTDEVNLDRQDFNVSQSNHFVLENCDSVLGISTPEPVILSFRQSEPAAKEVEANAPVFTKASIVTGDTCKAGDTIMFEIVDVDVAPNTPFVETVVYNTVTGETDYIDAYKIEEGIFRGMIESVADPAKGTDFDQSMNVSLTMTSMTMSM